MPWQTPAPFRPGIDVIKTPVLNSGGWSYSNCIRFRDGLPEKNGGWARLIEDPVIGTSRGMWIWSDLSGVPYLAAGTEQRLQVLVGGILYDITPLDETTDVTVDFSTVINTPTITIVDGSHDPSVGDWVRVNVPVAVGGLIIQGLYQVQTAASPSYTITAASNATSTVNNGGAVPLYSTTNLSPTVRVTLVNHGYTAAETWINQVATTIATIVLPAYTGWTITTIVDADNFEFTALTNANATTTGSENAGDAQLQYLVPTGNVSATLLAGFGVDLYSAGLYGISNAGPTYSTIRQWFLNNWGEDLIGNYPASPIFVWVPPVSIYGGNEALAINGTNFPGATSPPQTVNVSFVAMPQRIMMALGCDPSGGGSQDPNLVRWSNIDDFTDWVATATNQAGSFRIPTGSRIVGGLTGPTFGAIWTDRDMYVFNYIGFPLVFGFNRIAGGTPLLAGRCCAQARSIIYWASSNGIYSFDGSTVALVPCPVWDVMWRNLNRVQIDKCHLAVNSWFQELTLYFPAAVDPTTGEEASGEIDSYIRWNWRDNLWDYGAVGTLMTRTTWSDASELGPPIGIDTASLIQQHELAYDADGSPMGEFIQSGFFSDLNGWLFSQIDQVIADFKFEGDEPHVHYWIITINYPTDTPVTWGPFLHSQLAEAFDTVNAADRMAAIRIGMSSVGGWWRLGNFRYNITPDGHL